MLGKLPDRSQRKIFRTRLEDLINPQHKLALLADSNRLEFEEIHGKIERFFFAIFFPTLFPEK